MSDFAASISLLVEAALAAEAPMAAAAPATGDPAAEHHDIKAFTQKLAAVLVARKDVNAFAVVRVMQVPCGPYLETTLARQYLRGEISADGLASTDVDELVSSSRDPRRIGAGHIYALLVKNGMAPARAGPAARQVEVSVYNQVIHISKYVLCTTRAWENPDFVALYGARIGTISINLDPASSICSEHGRSLYQRICDGSIKFGELGAMSAEQLCPVAFQKEKQEIAARADQQVKEKVSALWACPECKARSCTYREVQDRSSDEPASIYCTCTVCGHNFKPH